MSILLKKKLEASYEDYFNHLYKTYGGIPEEHQAAMILRMNFVKEKILNKAPSEHKTAVERDWAFVVRREFIWDCNIRAAVDATAVGITSMIIR